MTKKPDELRVDSADTFKIKNAQYGSNSKNYAAAMKAFFPNGIVIKTEQDHERIHLLMLLIVKISRYCNNFELGGHEDSLNDAAVYSAMLRSLDAEINQIPF